MANDEIQRTSTSSTEEVDANAAAAVCSGSSSVDWEQAFLFYASLPSGKRSYAAVAAKFGGSPRTVETHGRTERWKERVRNVGQEAAARNHEELVEDRIEKVRTIQRLIDDSLLTYEVRLREGMRMGPADLERLHRLSRTVLDELSDTNQRSEAASQAADRTPEHLAAVLDALTESGALEQLGLTRNSQDLEQNEKGGS